MTVSRGERSPETVALDSRQATAKSGAPHRRRQRPTTARDPMRHGSVLTRALSAVGAQVTQAVASFTLMTLAARLTGLDELGRFSILYGCVVFATAMSTGFVGDSLTVLDRSCNSVRVGLQRWAVILPVALGTVAAVLASCVGFLGPGDAVLFGGALLVFMAEDLLRRLLMATMKFARILVVDLGSLVSSVLVLGIWELAASSGNMPGRANLGLSPLPLSAFLLALMVGQLAALGIAVWMLPTAERRWARGNADMMAVFKYGRWRAAQQGLRPVLQTFTRIIIMAVVSLAAAGQFEIARIYAAPALLLVGGISSFLFASFAKAKTETGRNLLRRADGGVLALVAVTIPGAGFALWIMPWAGPLITGHMPDIPAAAGWLAYGASVAVVTPYGALGAVRVNPALIFAIRSIDTLFSIASVAIALWLTGDPSLASGAMVPGSLLGGLAIRQLIVRKGRRANQLIHGHAANSQPKTAARPYDGHHMAAELTTERVPRH